MKPVRNIFGQKRYAHLYGGRLVAENEPDPNSPTSIYVDQQVIIFTICSAIQVFPSI